MALMTGAGQRDEAADAARFLTRLAYVVFALGAPVGVLLHPLAIYLLMPIGVGLILFAAALDPAEVDQRRFRRGVMSPVALLGLAAIAWAALSIVWTPFRVEAWQQTLRLLGFAAGISVLLGVARPFARATHVYLMALGLALAMATVFVSWIAMNHGARFESDRFGVGSLLVAILAYPAMAGLTARGRTGMTRALMALTLIFLYAIGSPSVMIAFLAGFVVLSFAYAGPERAAREMSYVAAAAIGLAPLFVLLAQPLLRLMLNAKLPDLPSPYPSIAYAFQIVTRDGLRLITGHGFETLQHGVQVGVLPQQAPQVALFQIWYELGIVGAWLAAAMAFFAFRAIGKAPARISPFLAAALTTALTLGVTQASLDDWTFLMLLALALVAGDLAVRSPRLTSRPSAESLSQV